MQDAIDKTASLSDVFEGEQRLRQDIQTARVNAETNLRTSGEFEKLTDEEKRLVVKMMLESKKNGIALDETEREKYKQLDLALRARVNEYSVRFLGCFSIPPLVFHDITFTRTILIHTL